MRECERHVNIRTWRKKRRLISTLDSVRERRRGYILFFCVLGLIAIFASRPTGIPLYDARLDDRAVPAIMAAFEEEGVNYGFQEGRLTVSADDLERTRGVLLRRGLPDFAPQPQKMGPSSGTEWVERVKRAESDTELFIRGISGVQDCRVNYGCVSHCYVSWENHTCDRVWARIVVNPAIELTQEEQLGLASFLAHSIGGLQVAGFCTIDTETPEKIYSCRLDLRQVTGELRLEDCEFDYY